MNNNRALPYTRNLIFQGNSLLDAALNHTGSNNQKYVTHTLYNNNIKGTYSKVSLIDYSISGQDQVQINALMSTQFTSSIVRPQDVVVIWEGTNNLSHYPSKSGATAFSELQTFINHVSQFTSKIIVCTTIARDLSGDPVDLMTRIDDYNVLIRANYSGNNLLDLASNANFWPRSAASNTTYYDVDKLHLVSGGQTLLITLLTNAITAIL